MTNRSFLAGNRFLVRFIPGVRVAVASLMLGLTLASSGCGAVAAAGAAGAGVAWVRGALESNIDRDIERVYRATQQAVRGLEFAVVSENRSGLDAAVVARTALDKKVEIRLKRVGSGATHVSIRIGLFGDEDMAVSILDRIKAEL